MSTQYAVGQVVFVISNEQARIISGLIIEEVTKKTVQSIEIDYIIRLNDANSTEIRLRDITDEVYNDVGLIRSTLITRATESIDLMIDAAVQLTPQRDTIKFSDVQQSSDESYVDLGDGKIARLSRAREIED